MQPEEQEDEEAYLWPDAVTLYWVWCDIQTQWRHGGMGGITGLDYAGVRAHLDEEGYTGEERKEMYAGIRAAERAVLEVRAEQAAKREAATPTTR